MSTGAQRAAVGRGRMRSRAPACAVALAVAASLLAGCGGSSSSTATTSSSRQRPEIVAELRSGVGAAQASALATGKLSKLPGLVGSDWNATSPRTVVFFLAASATVHEISTVATGLARLSIVEAVHLHLG